MAAILNSAMLNLDTWHLGFIHLVIISQFHSKILSLHSDSDSYLFNLTQTHSFSPNLMKAAILNSVILDSTILHKTLTSNLFNSDSNLMMAAYLQLGHLGFSHLSFSSQTHPHLPRLVPTYFAQKKLHSFILTQLSWWQPSWILPCWIQTLPSWIQTPCYHLSDSLKNTLNPIWLWLKLIPSYITWWWQPSWIHPFHKTLTQTNTIWLKLIHSNSTWWWQPSWILPSWIQLFWTE